MSKMTTNQDRPARAQKILNVAWIAGATGMISTLAGMGLGVPVDIISPWLAMCGLVVLAAAVFSLVAFLSP